MNIPNESIFRRERHSDRGQALAFTAVMMFALLCMAALVVDLGDVYFSYEELQSATQAAALAGGANITNGNAVTVATSYSALKGDANAHANLQSVAMANGSPKLLCLTPSTVGLPPCFVWGSQPSANAIQVTETATVPTFFAKLFGVSSVPISATATASATGGEGKPYNIMLILDTTGSMSSTYDSQCTVPGFVATKGQPYPSMELCAQSGIQTLMQNMYPCAATPTSNTSCGSTFTPADEVGLMVFPGLCSVTVSSSGTCPTATSQTVPPQVTSGVASNGLSYAADDYSCPPTRPPVTAYNNNPAYLILPLQDNFRTSDSTINTALASVPIVDAVGAGGNGTSCTGVQTALTEATFYAGVITQATNYLTSTTTNPRANTGQNVMILLSDGDSNNATMTGTATTWSASTGCTEAVTAANAARALGVEIYSVSYNSGSTGCGSGDGGLTPCTTMQGISSGQGYFFSVPSSNGGTVCSGAVADTSLDNVFFRIASLFTTSRLIPNNTP